MMKFAPYFFQHCLVLVFFSVALILAEDDDEACLFTDIDSCRVNKMYDRTTS